MFCDALGDGEEYGNLLGHSLLFYTKGAGEPVRFGAPSYALDDNELHRRSLATTSILGPGV